MTDDELLHILARRYGRELAERIMASTIACNLIGHHLGCRVSHDGRHFRPPVDPPPAEA